MPTAVYYDSVIIKCQDESCADHIFHNNDYKLKETVPFLLLYIMYVYSRFHGEEIKILRILIDLYHIWKHESVQNNYFYKVIVCILTTNNMDVDSSVTMFL